jgi:murein DD-endopeptidase MepM/ murein hydrolase activator NlpD
MTTLDEYLKGLNKGQQEGNPLMAAVSPESPASWEIVKSQRELKTPDLLKGKGEEPGVIIRVESQSPGFFESVYGFFTGDGKEKVAVKVLPIATNRFGSLRRPTCAEDPIIDLYPTFYGENLGQEPKVGSVVTIDFQNKELIGNRYNNGILKSISKTNITVFGDCELSKVCAPESPNVTLRKQGKIINGQVVLANGPPIVGGPSGPRTPTTSVTGGAAPAPGATATAAACNIVGTTGGNGTYGTLGNPPPATELASSLQCTPASPNTPCVPIPSTVTPPSSVASLYPAKGWRKGSPFGPRNPGGGASTNHKGIDYACFFGTPVLAALDGIISVRQDSKGINSGYGKYILIKHVTYTGKGAARKVGKTFYTMYAHLDPASVAGMNGKSVKKGEQIGLVGNTGNRVPKTPPKYGAHLHFAVMTSPLNFSSGFVNPDTYFFNQEFVT